MVDLEKDLSLFFTPIESLFAQIEKLIKKNPMQCVLNHVPLFPNAKYICT